MDPAANDNPDPSQPAPQESRESAELQLCAGCLAPNEPEVNFCAKCGAPLSSYAATGPFESLFAEGYIYRRAVESPRRLVVVLFVWFAFGFVALMAVATLLVTVADDEFELRDIPLPALIALLALWFIIKTTRNYRRQRRSLSPTPETPP